MFELMNKLKLRKYNQTLHIDSQTYKLFFSSSKVESCISIGDVASAVTEHVKLYEICGTLQSSTCTNLQKFSYSICEKLYDKLRQTIERYVNIIYQFFLFLHKHKDNTYFFFLLRIFVSYKIIKNNLIFFVYLKVGKFFQYLFNVIYYQ